MARGPSLTRRLPRKAGVYLSAVASDPPAARRSDANSRSRIATVGLHTRGKDHMRCFHELALQQNAEIAALCDMDESVLGQRAVEYEKLSDKRPRFVTDLHRSLDDLSIGAIPYSTPSHRHALGTIWARRAGKDVFVENPFSYSIIEGRWGKVGSRVECLRNANTRTAALGPLAEVACRTSRTLKFNRSLRVSPVTKGPSASSPGATWRRTPCQTEFELMEVLEL